MNLGRFGYPVPVDDSCIFLQDFSDSLGTTYLDKSQYGNHATRYGPVQTNGIRGMGLYFDGTNDYMLVTQAASFAMDVITVAVWVNPADNRSMALLGKDLVGVRAAFVAWISAYYPYWEIGDGDGTNAAVRKYDTALRANVWSHLVFTYDGTDESGLLCYLNGAVLPVDYTSGTISGNMANIAEDLYLGRLRNGGSLFNGVLDSIRVWNRVLSVQEIKDQYDQYSR